MKVNNKGFAISTILYGMLSLIIIIVLLILAIMKSGIDMNRDLTDEIESRLNQCINLEVELEKCYFDKKMSCDPALYNNCAKHK